MLTLRRPQRQHLAGWPTDPPARGAARYARVMADAIAVAIMASLREAGEPVREAVLAERVGARLGQPADPERFLSVLERLVTQGHLSVSVEHDLRAQDPPPYQPRYYHLID